jgi:hypothetical protein
MFGPTYRQLEVAVMRQLTCALVVTGSVIAAADARPPAAWVTVTGRVVLPEGVPVPAPKFLPGPAAGVPDERVVVDPKTRGVRNVTVWLRPDSTDPAARLAADEVHPADARRPARAVVLDFGPRLVFEPRVAAARVGDRVSLQNLSPAATNVAWDSFNNGKANVALAPGQLVQLPAPLVAEGDPIWVRSGTVPTGGCVRVFDHPYYAVTDAAGRFELRDAPAGKYRLAYWHDGFGFKGGKAGRFGDPVEIAPGKDGTMALPPTTFDVTK